MAEKKNHWQNIYTRTKGNGIFKELEGSEADPSDSVILKPKSGTLRKLSIKITRGLGFF